MITRRDGSPAQYVDTTCDACGFAAPDGDWDDATGAFICTYCQGDNA